jgi:hypothetical protein
MPYGPCILCGATNYPSSFGGPLICPSCDCGNPPQQKQEYFSLFPEAKSDRIIELLEQIKDKL